MATTKATLLGHRSATSFSDLTLSGDLTVNGTTTTLDTAVQNVDKLEIGASSTDYGAKINQTSTGNILQLQDNGTDVMVVEDGGNVGIGGSPGARLHVETSGNTGIQIRSGTTTSNGFINFNDGATAKGQIFYDHDGDYMRLYVNGAERLRIDSSGNVLVGKTSSNVATEGCEIRSSGFVGATVDGGAGLTLRRLTSDGELQSFFKDTTKVGSIGTYSSTLYIGSTDGSDAYVRFQSNAVAPCASDGTPRDNIIDLGTSGSRFDDIYATNGTIQTSDRNEKQDIEELSEAEQRVAIACKGLLRKFRWKSEVDKKGDDARIHFGIIAQDLKSAFEAEGLDAGRYAMFIHSEWWESEETYTDDDGVERTHTITYDTEEEAPEGAIKKDRMGVRYSELLAFIIASI
jgi:hypothetical protein